MKITEPDNTLDTATFTDTAYNLCVLQEECAEISEETAKIIQTISKIRRFGMNTKVPKLTNTTNLQLLETEIGDLLAMVDVLVFNNVAFSADRIQAQKHSKCKKLKKYYGFS